MTFSPKQRRAAKWLARGVSVGDVASRLSVHPNTIGKWRRLPGWEELVDGFVADPATAALEEALDAVSRAATSIVVVSLGFDTYKDDPICDFQLTSSAYRQTGRSVAATGRRLVILQEGGYFLPAIGRNAVQWPLGVAGGQDVRQPFP